MERDDRRETSVVAGVAAKAKAQAEALKATPPEPSKPALFDAVRRQGERAAALDVAGIVEGIKAASPKTREQYRRTIKRRLLDTGGVPDLAEVSRASWYPTRAALRAGLAETYRVAKREYDKAMRAGDVGLAARCIQRATKALDGLEAVSSAKAPAPVKVERSARQRLPSPKAGSWQARVYEAATPTMRPAIAVLWATGCRPAELEQGVDVYIGEGGALRVRIPGAKVSDKNHSGQPVRVLEIAQESQAGKALLAALDGKKRLLVQRKANRLSKDFLDRIRPRLPKGWTISAYSFRHQTAANLKADLKDPAEVAQAMGHRATRSQQAYGTKGQKQRGGGAVIQAKATHPAKETRGFVVSPPRPSTKNPSASLSL